MTSRDTDNRDPVNRDPDNDFDNRKETALAASSLTGGAVASLAALGTTLNNVDTTSIIGGSERPLLIFKSRDSGGIWTTGQKRTHVEEGSSWAVNPSTFQRGYVCFDADKKVGERLLPISLPMPDLAELPDRGFTWQEQWAVNMKCVDGADAGKEVIFKASTVGGRQAIAGLIAAIRERINGGRHEGKPVPIVHLEKYDYPHPQYGKTVNPLLTIVDWAPFEGPETSPQSQPSSPPPTSPAAEQPRRRRVIT
jgi:hypothetical protein